MKTGGGSVRVYIQPFFNLRARNGLLINATPMPLHPSEKEMLLFVQ